MLTLFDATITKSSKTVLARCGKDKNFYWQNTTTYDDGTKDVSHASRSRASRRSRTSTRSSLLGVPERAAFGPPFSIAVPGGRR